jgi:phenylacetate-coenzyme A ligase PaaK-like adenylate-forming protein
VTGPNTRTLEKLICTAAMSRISPCVSAGDREILPIDVALVLYDFPEVSTPSAEYQIVRPAEPARDLHVRCEHAPGVDRRALAARLAARFRECLGVTARLELVDRGGLPRFAYKAARVVDE